MQKPQRVQSMGFSITSNIRSIAMTSRNSTCEICNNQFKSIKGKANRFCSVECLRKHQKSGDLKNKSQDEIEKLTDEFIEKSRIKHGNKYDYRDSVYITARSKVKIHCPYHGLFEQVAFAHYSGRGCDKCAHDKLGKSKRLKFEDFVSRANIKHNNKYKYPDESNLENSQSIINIECGIHGVFQQQANSHLCGRGCPHCALDSRSEKNKLSFSEFVKTARSIHGEKYAYHECDYNGTTRTTRITCKKHGDFYQIPRNHYRAEGCKECIYENKQKTTVGGWSRKHFVKRSENRVARLYVIHCFDDSESFYKIGITTKSVKDRFSGRKQMPYEYTELFSITGEGGFIYDLETRMHKLLKSKLYSPKLTFGGSATECFSEITKPVHKLLRELSTTDQLQLIA